ncbi:MAG: ATP-dependent Clp protease proteolytic subunit, partial [uncultured Gemmatimonadaceae bacterium]
GNGNDLPAVHHRALQPGRAHLRHLLAAADGPHRLHGHARDRRRGEHRDRAAALPRGRQPGPRHQPVHQLAGRQRVGGARDLRHDAVHQAAGAHHLHGDGGEHGVLPARGREQGAPLGAAALAHHDAPAVGRRAGHGGRHRGAGEGDPLPALED